MCLCNNSLMATIFIKYIRFIHCYEEFLDSIVGTISFRSSYSFKNVNEFVCYICFVSVLVVCHVCIIIIVKFSIGNEMLSTQEQLVESFPQTISNGFSNK